MLPYSNNNTFTLKIGQSVISYIATLKQRHANNVGFFFKIMKLRFENYTRFKTCNTGKPYNIPMISIP
jgi:hypothetical protein